MAIISWKLASIWSVSKQSRCQNETHFVSLRWWVPPSKCYFSIWIVPHFIPRKHTNRHIGTPTHARTHTNTHKHSHKLHLENYITSPAVVWKLHLSPTIPPITPQVSSFLFPSLSPYLTILGFSLHFNSALNCQAWIALWTAWGGQDGRRCVWMRESLRYHHLFSFSSPSGAVRSQTRYHSLPTPDRESQHNREEME